MNYRSDKKGTQLSILGFGCMRLPSSLGRIDLEKSDQLILEAYEKGVNYFDTAYLYPGSEAALGEILQRHGLRKKVFIATKLPHMICKQYSDFDKYFDIQKQRLRTDYIDYYLIHNISEYKQWSQLCEQGIQEWIQNKKEKGEIRQIGFSFHGSKEDFALLLESYDWDFCQVQYNYINVNYQAGAEGVRNAAGKNIPVVVMEPLLGGKLATGLPPKAIDVFYKAHSTRTPVEWALRWLWNQPEVTLVLSGMGDMEQLKQNIGIAEECSLNCMSDEELRTIDDVVEVFNASFKVPCTGCNYCMPCPQGINIPAMFAAYNASYAMDRMTGINQYVTSASWLTDQPHGASTCIQCGKCEKHCPQHIPIRSSLASVKKRMEPLWFRAFFPIYKSILHR